HLGIFRRARQLHLAPAGVIGVSLKKAGSKKWRREEGVVKAIGVITKQEWIVVERPRKPRISRAYADRAQAHMEAVMVLIVLRIRFGIGRSQVVLRIRRGRFRLARRGSRLGLIIARLRVRLSNCAADQNA